MIRRKIIMTQMKLQADFLKAWVSPAGDFVRRYRPNIVKIDVEGFEWASFKSILPCLDGNCRPVFLNEIEFGGNWPKMAESVAALKRIVYQLFDADCQPAAEADLCQGRQTIDAIFRPVMVS